MTTPKAPAPGTAQKAVVATGKDDKGRLQSFVFRTDVGMLEALGVNMYTSLGKSLVEFVANAYDSDADYAHIKIPFDKIDATRETILDAHKKTAKAQGKKSGLVTTALPADLTITISDNGHGMSDQDVADKFLVLNRNRRTASSMSENGKRFVMGRKGLGKLAGFGTAECIRIKTKRKGMNYFTVFELDYSKIKDQKDLREVQLVPNYIETPNVDEHGTEITLSRLRYDASKASSDDIEEILAQNFTIVDQNFSIKLNDIAVAPKPAAYEFKYPPEDKCKDGLAEEIIIVNDEDLFSIRYRVMIRYSKHEGDRIREKQAKDGVIVIPDGTEYGNIAARQRGARIYCNGRLAAGPSLLNLPTGMHNQQAQSYLECIVFADDLDRLEVDHIATSRTDLRSDNEVVAALVDEVTKKMATAINEHAKFREIAAKKDVDEDEKTKAILKTMELLSPKVRKPATKVLYTVAAQLGVSSPLYQTMAPLLVQSMNAGEVLKELIHQSVDPKSITIVTEHLSELGKIEQSDVLKHYRGRRSGIEALRKLHDKANANWLGARFEKELHSLLKKSPWLVRPDLSRFFTSDKTMGDVARQINLTLEIDENAPEIVRDAHDNIGDEKLASLRPDLVVVAVEPYRRAAAIIELKSPNIPLTADHVTQLEGYMLLVESILKDGRDVPVLVTGHLIGTLPDPQTKNSKEQVLLKKRREQSEANKLEIITIKDLLDRAMAVHLDAIDALEKEEAAESEGADSQPLAITSEQAPPVVPASPAVKMIASPKEG